MADETPVVEGAPATDAASAASAAEPQTPEWDWTGDRSEIDRLANEGYEQHQTEQVLQELAAAPEITVAELRRLPGAEGMSDEQLLAMWQQVNGQQSQDGKTAAERARDELGRFTKAQEKAQEKQDKAVEKAVQRAWKALSAEGQEVTDLSTLTAEQLLALQIEYNANGKPQRKSWDEVVRNAQLGHYNGERMNQLTTERNTALEQLRQYQQTAQQLESDKQTWLTALGAAANNNFGPLQTLLNAFMEASNAAPPPAPSNMVSVEQVERERAGQQLYQQAVLPKAGEIAQRYGLTQEEVAQGIMHIVQHEPPEFFTQARLQQIMEHDIVMAIEQMQREHPPASAAADDRDAKIAALEAQIAELTKTKATQHNTHVQAVHQRRRVAPPAPATMPGNSSIESPDFNSAHDVRDWLRNLK